MESFVLFIFFIVLYFTYTRPILKEKKRLKREEEEAVIAKKRNEEYIRKFNEEVLSKISYPDPSTVSFDEMYDFLDSIDIYDPNGYDIKHAYSELANRKLGISNFFLGYVNNRVLKRKPNKQ